MSDWKRVHHKTCGQRLNPDDLPPTDKAMIRELVESSSEREAELERRLTVEAVRPLMMEQHDYLGRRGDVNRHMLTLIYLSVDALFQRLDGDASVKPISVKIDPIAGLPEVLHKRATVKYCLENEGVLCVCVATMQPTSLGNTPDLILTRCIIGFPFVMNRIHQ